MQHLTYILFQIDEARRYIEDGRIEQLRLALLLLDNAAEIQMEKIIREYIPFEEMKEQVRNQALQIPENERPESLLEITEWQPLSGSKKRKISRYFDEKIKYLSNRQTTLDSRLCEPLRYLHKYRNEAYHRARVRRQTIDTAARILLDINCEMLLALPRGLTYNSGEDYSWVKERFKIEPTDAHHDGFIDRLVADIRSKISLTDQAIAKTLAEHMRNRIADFLETLDFIQENIPGIIDREDALKHCLYFGSIRRDEIEFTTKGFENYNACFTLDTVEETKKRFPKIACLTDSLSAFNAFSNLENQFEKIEEDVEECAMEVDRMIQLEIDRPRGK